LEAVKKVAKVAKTCPSHEELFQPLQCIRTAAIILQIIDLLCQDYVKLSQCSPR